MKLKFRSPQVLTLSLRLLNAQNPAGTSLPNLEISHPIMYVVKATRFNHGFGAGERDEILVLTCISPLTDFPSHLGGPSQIYFSPNKTKISPSAR